MRFLIFPATDATAFPPPASTIESKSFTHTCSSYRKTECQFPTRGSKPVVLSMRCIRWESFSAINIADLVPLCSNGNVGIASSPATDASWAHADTRSFHVSMLLPERAAGKKNYIRPTSANDTSGRPVVYITPGAVRIR